MPRFIDADKLVDDFSSNGSRFVYGDNVVSAIISRINAHPTADVREERYGYWIVVGRTEGRSNILQCSACKKIRRGVAKTAYCKDCGAKMDRGITNEQR